MFSFKEAVRFKERKYVVLGVLFIAWLLGVFDRTAINVAVIPIQKEFGISPTQVGMILSSFALGGLCLNLFGGFFADKYKSEKVLVIAMIFWSLFTGFTAGAWSFYSLLFIRYIFGAAEGVFSPASSVTIAEWFRKDEYGTAKSILLSCSHLGTAFGTLAIGLLVYYFNWRMSFVILGVLGLLMSVAFFKVSKDNEGKIRMSGMGEAKKSKKVPLREAFKYSLVWKAPIIQFGGACFLWGLNTWLPQYWVKVKGLNLKEMGAYSMIPSLISFFVMIIMGWILDKYLAGKEKIVLVIAIIISAFSVYGMYTANTILLGFVFQSLTGLGMGMIAPVIYAMVLKYVPRELVGTASGLTAFGTAFAGVIAPTLMGYSITLLKGSYSAVFGMIIVILVICGIIALTMNTKKYVVAQETKTEASA